MLVSYGGESPHHGGSESHPFFLVTPVLPVFFLCNVLCTKPGFAEMILSGNVQIVRISLVPAVPGFGIRPAKSSDPDLPF